MIYGLAAALGWGVADLSAAVVGRRIGSIVTTVVAQIAGSSVIITLFLVRRPGVDLSTGTVLGLSTNGVLAALAYLALYRALQLGPVALVSPIVAAYAAVAVPLAVIVAHESLAGMVLAGAVVTLLGVVLTSTDLRRLGSGVRWGRGVPVALVSMALFGVSTFILGRFSQDVGWLPALAVSRVVGTLVLLTVAVARRSEFRGVPALGLGAAGLVGLADILGGSMFSLGSQVGLISIVAAASATFTLIPVVGGVVLFGERPAISQAAGVVLVVGGLLLMGLGR